MKVKLLKNIEGVGVLGGNAVVSDEYGARLIGQGQAVIAPPAKAEKAAAMKAAALKAGDA